MRGVRLRHRPITLLLVACVISALLTSSLIYDRHSSDVVSNFKPLKVDYWPLVGDVSDGDVHEARDIRDVRAGDADVGEDDAVIAVLRNPVPTGESVDEARMEMMVVSVDVMEEAEPGSSAWRASAWTDDQFEARDLFGLNQVLNWLQKPTGGCRELQLLGGPRRGGNGVSAEQAVCMDQPLGSSAVPLAGAANTSCLVYLFGVDDDWTFAEQLAARGCVVHVFDHRLTSEPPGEHAYHVLFHRLGVGRNRHRPRAGGLVLTLDGVMATLNHRRRELQYLRADLGGLETDMLLDQLVDPKLRRDRVFVLDRAEQIAARVHLRPHVERELTFYRQLSHAFGQLDRLGYDLVHSVPYEAGNRWRFPGRKNDTVVLMYDVLLVRKRRPTADFDAHMVPRTAGGHGLLNWLI